MSSVFVRASIVGALAAAASAHGAAVSSSNFDQIARINDLGGTVRQIGGAGPGTLLTTAASFVGGTSTTTGVLVTLPNWRFLDAVVSFTDVGDSEPGNIPTLMLGVPTDLTFTEPGDGGPDGTVGDGSIHYSHGDIGVFRFNSPVIVPIGSPSDVFILTNTAGNGRADIEFFLGDTLVDSLQDTVVPGQAAHSGVGGLLINLEGGLVFDRIRISDIKDSVEIDAIAVRVPAPSASGLLAAGSVLAVFRRRRV